MSPFDRIPVWVAAAILLMAGALQAQESSTSVEALKQREAKVRHVFEHAAPSVVALVTPMGGQGSGSGSGVIVNEDGLILTAGHVTQATGENIDVMLADGRQLKGKALGANMNRDASMVQLLETHGEKFPFTEMAPDDSYSENDWVVAMGHPGGYDPIRPAPLRVGKLLQKQGHEIIVTDCTLAGGDSGGPLFNLEGQLIAIHSSISGSLAHNMHVPVDVYRKYWNQMLAGESWGELSNELFTQPLPGYEERLSPSKNRALLGATLDRLSRNGVLATSIMTDSPAEAGGMRQGDVIVKFNNTEVKEYPDLYLLLSDTEPGDRVVFSVMRHGELIDLEIEMGDRRKTIK